MTWSVSNGGRLCVCGHMKCQHTAGENRCACCLNANACQKFRDRAPETNIFSEKPTRYQTRINSVTQ